MSIDKFGGDVVAQRKAEVRKYVNIGRAATGVGLVSVIAGAILSNSFLLFVLPVIAAIVIGFSVYNVRKVVNHKDQW